MIEIIRQTRRLFSAPRPNFHFPGRKFIGSRARTYVKRRGDGGGRRDLTVSIKKSHLE